MAMDGIRAHKWLLILALMGSVSGCGGDEESQRPIDTELRDVNSNGPASTQNMGASDPMNAAPNNGSNAAANGTR